MEGVLIVGAPVFCFFGRWLLWCWLLLRCWLELAAGSCPDAVLDAAFLVCWLLPVAVPVDGFLCDRGAGAVGFVGGAALLFLGRDGSGWLETMKLITSCGCTSDVVICDVVAVLCIGAVVEMYEVVTDCLNSCAADCRTFRLTVPSLSRCVIDFSLTVSHGISSTCRGCCCDRAMTRVGLYWHVDVCCECCCGMRDEIFVTDVVF